MSIVLHWIGVDNASGPWYLFWSGIFGDVAIFAAFVVGLRHMNCIVTGCKKLRTFPVAGTPWRCCKKHHPYIDQSNKLFTPERVATFAERHA